jgi:hypothetical protein
MISSWCGGLEALIVSKEELLEATGKRKEEPAKALSGP